MAWHVMIGELRLGDGSGYGTWNDAKMAAVHVLASRRERVGCSRVNGSGARCVKHSPKTKPRCAAWERLTTAMDAAYDMREPGTGVVTAWRALYASAIVTIRRGEDGRRPGVGLGDLALERDGGGVVAVKVTGSVSPLGEVLVTETARKRGRTGEVRRVPGELVMSR